MGQFNEIAFTFNGTIAFIYLTSGSKTEHWLTDGMNDINFLWKNISFTYLMTEHKQKGVVNLSKVRFSGVRF